MVAYVTGTVNQELLLRNEYLGAENRILEATLRPYSADYFAIQTIVVNSSLLGTMEGC
jgi:hypothetical protein